MMQSEGLSLIGLHGHEDITDKLQCFSSPKFKEMKTVSHEVQLCKRRVASIMLPKFLLWSNASYFITLP